MIVTENTFSEAVEKIGIAPKVSVDTETTGLKVYKDDRLFSIIISTESEDYYFNFNKHDDHLGNYAPHILQESCIGELIYSIQDKEKLFMANAKYDMGILQKEHSVRIKWPAIHDVLVMDRLLFNDHIQYNLDIVSKRNGLEKLDIVEEYIDEHHLWHWENPPHRKRNKFDKIKYYHKVPFDIMSTYGCKDGRITYTLGVIQEAKLKDYHKPTRPIIYDPYELELKTTKALFTMEQEGIKLDEKFTETKAKEHQVNFENLTRRFHDETKQVFTDSAGSLLPIFERVGLTPPKTEKGRDSITDEWLEGINHPLGDLVRSIRSENKNQSFYKSYLWFKSSDGMIHANTNQSGTRTGRFSMSNPNLQQTPDSEVRKSFIACEDEDLISLDFDQQEYRMMLDYAEQMDLIEEVKGGLDVHTATAKLMGVDRKPAKTLNFLLLYGGGVVKLALTLFPVTANEPTLWYIWKKANNWKLDAEDMKWEKFATDEVVEQNLPLLKKANELRDLYFTRLPKVQGLVEECKKTAQDRGYIRTWTGRRIHFRKNFAYKAPNALIQGGASDVCKTTIVRIDELLQTKRSKLALSVHDEMVVRQHKSEPDVTERVKDIMQTTFPHKHLPLTAAANKGQNLWDMEKI